MSKKHDVKTGRDYQRDLERTLNGCTVDAFIWGGIALLFLIAGLVFAFVPLPEEIERYRVSVMMLTFTVAFAAFAKCLQSVTERTAIQDVARESVCAVKMTQKQQNKVFRTVARQSFREHLVYFLIGAVPVTAIMLVLYFNTGDNSSLFAMGVLDGLLLFGTLLAYGLDAGRLSSEDGFCTVSDRGIISGNEILPFSAKDGDVLKFQQKDNCYEVVFKRKCYLGIPFKYTFPLPKDGSVSRVAEGQTEEEVLLEAFCLTGSDVTEKGSVWKREEQEDLDMEAPAETVTVPDATEEPEAKAANTVPAEQPSEEKEEETEIVPEPAETEEAETEPEGSSDRTEEDNVPEEIQDTEAEESSLVDDGKEKEEEEIEEEQESGREAMFRETFEPVPVLTEKRSGTKPGPWLKRAAVAMAAILVLAVGFVVIRGMKTAPSADPAPQPVPVPVQPSQPSQQEGGNGGDSFVDEMPRSELQQDEDGIWYVTIGGERVFLVNKDYPAPENYGEVDEIASGALGHMIDAAKADGVDIVIVSGYRSYQTQADLYESKAAQVGEEMAEYWTAVAGTSEHQTGLAFDLNGADSPETLMNTEFEETDAYAWLIDHCAEYGFILRYPKGAREITGYNFEPWHFRYVGKEVAADIMSSGVTLEEYLGVYPPEEG